MIPGKFEILCKDGAARRGRLATLHGVVDTPAFMPVGTLATVKGLTPVQLRETGSTIILANAYHLALRPGEDIVASLGGLHRFMNWDGPILTDSGGYQVFSLSSTRTVSDEGVAFRSHLDGSQIFISPERATKIQNDLGADIIMAFDECPPPLAPLEQVSAAVNRTLEWAKRCRDAHSVDGQLLFGIVQGGAYDELRTDCASRLAQMDFPGYGIGGLGIGEGVDAMLHMVTASLRALPFDKPRYLMGLGRPDDIVRSIALGVDMFDCVVPTRNARNAMLFTDSGPIRMRNVSLARDDRPVMKGCTCYTCRSFSRAYLRHLYIAGEMLAGVLGSIHNIAYYQDLVARCRSAIEADEFTSFANRYIESYRSSVEES